MGGSQALYDVVLFCFVAYYGRGGSVDVAPDDNNLWVVGVAVGAVILIIIIIWVIFCFIIKKRGPESTKEEPAHLLRMKGGTKVTMIRNVMTYRQR
jgi:hypothetical protein